MSFSEQDTSNSGFAPYRRRPSAGTLGPQQPLQVSTIKRKKKVSTDFSQSQPQFEEDYSQNGPPGLTNKRSFTMNHSASGDGQKMMFDYRNSPAQVETERTSGGTGSLDMFYTKPSSEKKPQASISNGPTEIPVRNNGGKKLGPRDTTLTSMNRVVMRPNSEFPPLNGYQMDPRKEMTISTTLNNLDNLNPYDSGVRDSTATFMPSVHHVQVRQNGLEYEQDIDGGKDHVIEMDDDEFDFQMSSNKKKKNNAGIGGTMTRFKTKAANIMSPQAGAVNQSTQNTYMKAAEASLGHDFDDEKPTTKATRKNNDHAQKTFLQLHGFTMFLCLIFFAIGFGGGFGTGMSIGLCDEADSTSANSSLATVVNSALEPSS